MIRARYYFLLIVGGIFALPLPTYSDFPDAPVILDSGAGGCVPRAEICGDGVDQNCDGSDTLCPGADGDRDGFTTNDCDNANRNLYPGISIPCSGSCGQGTKTCQSNGTFSACSCSPLCEATGGGSCYYVSALTGSDSNPGTFQAPWKTYLMFTSYYSTNERPSGWKALQPGDVVYFMSGVYKATYNYQGTSNGIFFRSLHGSAGAPITLKAYPGAHPVLAPSNRQSALYALQSSHLTLEGFEITDIDGTGLRFAESSNLEVRNCWIHDIGGTDNNNIGGIKATSVTNASYHHNLIHDCYDRTNADTGGNKTENSRNFVLFGGGNNHVHHNVIFQTPPKSAQKTGGCLTHKHSATLAGQIFEVNHNVFWNCAFTAIGSGSFGSRIHHNLIIDSDPIQLRDFGGDTHNEDNIIEYNTMVNTSGLSYNPTLTWGPIGFLTYRNNIIVGSGGSDVVSIHPFGSDSIYSATVNKLTFSNNCYNNPGGQIQFDLFSRNSGSAGPAGAVYSLSGWQGLGYDSGSIAADPQLNANHLPQNASCQNKGWGAN